MIRIAFCDDELSVLQELHRLIEKYREERKRELWCAAFQSPLELLTEMEGNASFDILFLDVVMPGENGIETAREIRLRDDNIKIIFLTSSTEFAVQSYAVGAFFYQLKPLCEESFFSLMDSVLDSCARECEHSLILRCREGITRIELERLEYCEVVHRTLYFHLTSGKVLECSGSLDDLSRQLAPYGNFVRSHRSYLVNLGYVQSMSFRTITMSDRTQIPIPRGKYNEIKDAFLEYAFQRGQVIL